MKREALRQRLETWLLAVWFGYPRGWQKRIYRITAPVLHLLSEQVAKVASRRATEIQRLPDGTRPAVIIVGNLVVGGSGKTPMVIALARALTARGLRVGLLARGYRTRKAGARLIDATTPLAEAGDEALLLARQTGLPVAVGSRRKAALDLLQARHPDLDVVISDDGLQHRALPRTLELVMMHPLGLGNGHCLPAGPLREPIERLNGVDALLLPEALMPTARADLQARGLIAKTDTAEGAGDAGGLRTLNPVRPREEVPAWQPYAASQAATSGSACSRHTPPPMPASIATPAARRAPSTPPAQPLLAFDVRTDTAGIRPLGVLGPEALETPEAFAARVGGQKLAAVAGISRPERFFSALKKIGLDVARYPLPDHAHISPGWLASLPEARIIMTAKDAVKCLDFPEVLRNRCHVLEIEAVPDPALIEWLMLRLDAADAAPGAGQEPGAGPESTPG